MTRNIVDVVADQQEEGRPARRLARPGSPTWVAMLDAAEQILLEDGAASLTSRQVADRIGVKQRLVYYYFHSMDDLVVDTFRRLAHREVARLDSALAATRPLHEVWNVCIRTSDARLISEFTALANRIPALRREVILFIETARRIQVEALRASAPASLPAAGLALLATSLALSLTREVELGVTSGHAEAAAMVEALLRQLEPEAG